ncbi:VC0807 family protein [Oleiharenicola lentus]|uniref:VC0807 family protein n=1 Tax=Oleiharenicola lentus TaxID=2508720 RepID=UPI003F66E5D0
MSSVPKRENLWLNIGCNVVLPGLILSRLSTRLGSKEALILALAFPLGYGIYDLIKRRNFNFLSALGFASTLATGGLGLLKLSPLWFAIKEAVVPTIIGLTVIISQWTKKPLVRSLLLNEQVVDVPRVEAALVARNAQVAFNGLMRTSSALLAFSFAVSAVLNFVLARYLITAMPDTPEFNEQLGRMTWMSWPVIVVPSMAMMMFALWKLLKGIEGLTGLTLEHIMHQPELKAKPMTSPGEVLASQPEPKTPTDNSQP